MCLLGIIILDVGEIKMRSRPILRCHVAWGFLFAMSRQDSGVWIFRWVGLLRGKDLVFHRP